MKPSKMARISMRRPIVQFSSRGLRKAPVRKMRPMCTTIDPVKMSAAQWCIWRISSPPRTLKEMLHRRAVGLRDPLPVQRLVGAVVDDLLCRGDVVQGQEDARRQQHDERVQRDLAQHEGPVVREDLVEEDAATLGDAEAVVELVDDLADGAEGPLGLTSCCAW